MLLHALLLTIRAAVGQLAEVHKAHLKARALAFRHVDFGGGGGEQRSSAPQLSEWEKAEQAAEAIVKELGGCHGSKVVLLGLQNL